MEAFLLQTGFGVNQKVLLRTKLRFGRGVGRGAKSRRQLPDRISGKGRHDGPGDGQEERVGVARRELSYIFGRRCEEDGRDMSNPLTPTVAVADLTATQFSPQVSLRGHGPKTY